MRFTIKHMALAGPRCSQTIDWQSLAALPYLADSALWYGYGFYGFGVMDIKTPVMRLGMCLIVKC
jgi:hypothetical protein